MNCPCCHNPIIVQRPPEAQYGRQECARCRTVFDVIITVVKPGDKATVEKYREWLHKS